MVLKIDGILKAGTSGELVLFQKSARANASVQFSRVLGIGRVFEHELRDIYRYSLVPETILLLRLGSIEHVFPQYILGKVLFQSHCLANVHRRSFANVSENLLKLGSDRRGNVEFGIKTRSWAGIVA